jgi:16S rRNA (cytidine1402-2'-O)-methyltransferase
MMPCPISEGHISSLSQQALDILHQTTHFWVERAKTARHFIKAAEHPVPISELNIHEITKDKQEDEAFLQLLLKGHNVAVISEAGCPGIADPGADAVSFAHKNGIKVVPLVGPSSILLALMSSGFSGQSFAFNGYLSNKKPELMKELRQLESTVQRTGQTQIFMETPYRNGFLLDVAFDTLQSRTKLCVACDINQPTEWISTRDIGEWKKFNTKELHKRPCIFMLGR